MPAGIREEEVWQVSLGPVLVAFFSYNKTKSYYNQRQLKEELILAYSARGLKVHKW